MISPTRPALLLLLLVGAVFAQEDAPADAPGDADGDAAGKAAEGECEECEEAWEYVEFLKTEVNEKVTETLQDFKTSKGADQTVSQTMEQVMEIREAILTRIKAIRKNEGVTICPEQNVKQEQKLSEFRMEIMSVLLKLVDAGAAENLKEISGQLLKFRSSVSDEVMRLLMLPQPTCGDKPKVPTTDCEQCQVLSDLSFTLKNLQICASKKAEEEGEAPEQAAEAPEAEAKDGDSPEPGEDCVEPIMYSMTLIVMNEKLDSAIAGLYTQIVEATEEEERTKFYDMLTSLKQYREKIDEMISKLLELGEDAAKLKKFVSRNLRVLIIEVTAYLDLCNQGCGNKDCASCAGPVLTDAIDKMEEYTEFINSDREDEEKKDFVRGDLISHINKINTDSRAILVQKVETGELEQCDKDKLEVYNRIKAPMWMLVNSTIFSEMTEISQMVLAMDEQLKSMLGGYCANTNVDIPKIIDEEGPNCEWEEYEKTKEYLVEVDNTIQEALFKAKKDEDKTTALLGFVKIQEMFDKRVKKLFEEEVVCPDELQTIKKEYMSQLNKCMIEFMNPKVKFSEMTRLQRISCIKGLRNSMEDRTAKLLQFELEKSLSGIKDGN